MNNDKQKILFKIKENIKDKKPIPNWIILGVRIGLLSVGASFIVGAISFIGMFVFDYFEKRSIESFLNHSVYSPAHYLYEYLAVAIFLIFVFIFIYRKFDLPGVKDRNKIFLIGIVVSVIFGFLFAEIAENIFFVRHRLQTVKSTYLDHMPLRQNERAQAHDIIKASSGYAGYITMIEKDNQNMAISIKNKTDGVRKFTIDKSKIKEDIRVGEKVVVKISNDGVHITKLKIVK